jgi:hypothetical protein
VLRGTCRVPDGCAPSRVLKNDGPAPDVLCC